MAQKVSIVLVDDIDGSDAEETVSFALDGRDYEIDLNSKNAAGLRDALAPYVGHARRAGSRKRGRSGGGPSPADIRSWARENGFEVPDRGRVSQQVKDAYVAAH
ncbi:MAG: Lsr2 family protein [Marmoricola sp.]